MCNKVSLNIAKFAAGEKLTAVTLRQHVAPKLARVGMFSDRLIANFQLSAFRVPEKVAYPVLVEGRVHQQIHIPEYPVEVPCKFPKSTANQLSPSKQIIQKEMYGNCLTLPSKLFCVIYFTNIAQHCINQTNTRILRRLHINSRGRRIERRYFRLDQIQDGGLPPSWKISNGHISAPVHPS